MRANTPVLAYDALPDYINACFSVYLTASLVGCGSAAQKAGYDQKVIFSDDF